MPTIAHISDLHLQSGVPERQAQVEPILQKINAMKPDLVVISGDVTDDGWDSVEELEWAKAWLDERIEGEWFAVPGNHDVGNFSSLSEGKINAERVENWEEVFSDPYLLEINGWNLALLNSMVLGGGLDQSQLNWLNSIQKQLRNKPLAVFLHSPLFIDSIHETINPDANYWLGDAGARKEWLQAMSIAPATLIGSGHVHQTRLTEADAVKIAWAPPASGTWVHAPGLPNPPMPERTGFLLHHLHDDGRVESELVECAPMLKLYEHNPWA